MFKTIIDQTMKYFTLLALVSCAKIFASEPIVQFSFDRDWNADKGGVPINISGAQGALQGKILQGTDTTAETALDSGLSGRALRIGTSRDGATRQIYEYRPQPAIKAAAGSFSVWIRPHDWEPAEKSFHHFVTLFAASGADRICLYKYIEHPGLVAFAGPFNKFKGSVRSDFSNWKKGGWYHATVTWDRSAIVLFINGRKVGESQLAQPLTSDFNRIVLGEHWSGNPGTTFIDDLFFFDRTLTGAEVAQEYQRHANKLTGNFAPVAFTCGKATPSLDGLVKEAEYALGLSGMYDASPTDFYFSQQQSRVFFSYDDMNLYLGMRSPADANFRRLERPRDGEIWLDDSVDFFIVRNGEGTQFIFNAAGSYYDSRGNNANWNPAGIQNKSSLVDGEWHLESVIPWAALGGAPADGDSLRLNVTRTFPGSALTCLAPGDYFISANYPKITFHANAPHFDIAKWGELFDGQIDFFMIVKTHEADRVTVDLASDADVFPMQYHKTEVCTHGNEVTFQNRGKIQAGKPVRALVTSEKHGELYRADLISKELRVVRLMDIRTDRPGKQLVLISKYLKVGSLNIPKIKVKLLNQQRQLIFEQEQDIPVNQELVKNFFSIRGLPNGTYRLEYEYSLMGEKIAGDYAHYAICDERPWPDSGAGSEDIVPAPWTAPAASALSYSCAQKEISFANGFLLEQISICEKNLLSRPAQLLLNGKPLIFNCHLLEKKNSYAVYRLENSALSVNIKIEFDGFMLFTMTLADSGQPINSLELEVPLARKHLIGFDDCNYIYNKNDLADPEAKPFQVNLVERPYFWCGGDEIGLMGGSQSRRGWHLQDKASSLTVIPEQSEVLLRWRFVDSQLTASANRTMQFYLQPTPTRPKNLAAVPLRYTHNYMRFGDYTTTFFEHRLPGYYDEKKLRHFRDYQNTGKRMFYYTAPKGVSPLTPEWNFFSQSWSEGPFPGNYVKDNDSKGRAAEEFYTSAFGCLNDPDFFEYKLFSYENFITDSAYQVNDLYFDLCWPRPCRNPYHLCSWTDEFGFVHHDSDLLKLRELMLRVTRLLQRKKPDAMLIGHMFHDRTPADAFYDIIVAGEMYDREVTRKNSTYYDVLTPVTFRIAYATRRVSSVMGLIPQFHRGLALFAPAKASSYDPKAPENDRAICHFYSYMLLHDMTSDPIKGSDRINDFWKALDCANMAGGNTFYPYWYAEGCPARLIPNNNKAKLSLYGDGKGKGLLVLLNDSDLDCHGTLSLDTGKLGIAPQATLQDLISKKKLPMNNGKIRIQLEPRQAIWLDLNGK